MDKGFDCRASMTAARSATRARSSSKKACTDNDVPTCEHGRWTTSTTTDEVALPARSIREARQLELLGCSPASVWIKADRRNPLIPRETSGFGDLYRGRSAVERAFERG
jgi:hypothetical protein